MSGMEERTRDLIRELRETKVARASADSRVRELEKLLSDVCAKLESKTLETEIDGEQVTATLVETTRVSYDNDALKEMLGTRWTDAVTITEKVETSKLEALLKEGVIPQDQISKAAEIKKSRAYFRFS